VGSIETQQTAAADVSPVIHWGMSEVTIRDLRNHGGEVIDRVERGERLTITRDGRQVAELLPVGPLPVKAGVLIERWSRLPRLEPEGLRRDLDQVIDSAL
jgi:prevent-host-death family protein